MSEEKLDNWIEKTKEDANQKLLWQILGPQLDGLVENGSPDLGAFYEDLRTKQLVTEEEIKEMKTSYPLDSVSNQLNCQSHKLTLAIRMHCPRANWRMLSCT
jgi:hypothetical protein